MHDLAEVMEKMKPIKELKEKLLECFKAEISAKGIECVDTEEAGKVVDMIKDLAKTEKSCMEALYYQKVTEAMLSYEEPRYGYNANRSATTGRYTTSGRGHRMGFVPPVMMHPEMDWEDEYMMGSMGYTSERSSEGSRNERGRRSSGSDSSGYWSGRDMMDATMDPRYGDAYNKYQMTRRHYTESRSEADKKEMKRHAEEHLNDTIATVKDIWEDADPALKQKMKEDFTKLIGEMK